MSSNIVLIGSIVVGGIFLLSVMNFQSDLIDHSIEKSTEMYTQQTAASLMEIIEFDLRKMGSGLPSPAGAITSNPDTTDITFRADLDPLNLPDVDIIRYHLGGPAALTENPNDSLLFRTVNGAEEFRIPVRRFSIKLRDMTTAITTDLDNVSTIEVFLDVESTYSHNSSAKFARAAWRKMITPRSMIRQPSRNF